METYNAYKMDYKYIYYKCNHCFKIKNKIISNPITTTGKKYKGLKSCYHIYNSYNDFENRDFKTKSNCLFNLNKKIIISINDKTLKIKPD